MEILLEILWGDLGTWVTGIATIALLFSCFLADPS